MPVINIPLLLSDVLVLVLTQVRDKKNCFLGNIDNNNLQLEGWSGTFESPRYPLKYPNFMSCLWVITVHEGKRMKLNFQRFDVQWSEKCDKDYVKVFDGLHPTSILKKTLCGSYWNLGDDIYSSGRHLIVQFHSDGDNDDNYGFKAHFEAVNPSKCKPFFVRIQSVFQQCRETRVHQIDNSAKLPQRKRTIKLTNQNYELIGSLSNDEDNAEDETLKKIIYLLPSNVSAD